jgi:hypothetical protein
VSNKGYVVQCLGYLLVKNGKGRTKILTGLSFEGKEDLIDLLFDEWPLAWLGLPSGETK